MGCTSSAPKTFSANVGKEDKSIQFEEDAEETHSKPTDANVTESENRTEINVLPPSDATEPVQLVRNNQSTNSLKSEKDLNGNGHIVEAETENIDPSNTNNVGEQSDDPLTKFKLEAVVGKFIEIVQQDTSNEGDANSDMLAESTGTDSQEANETIQESEPNEDDGEHESKSEEVEEPSPSQSQGSRATRWEALADIAAELPPSLAVDPQTGQIYSLSK